MDAVMSWTTGVGIVVFGIFFWRLLRTVYVDGRLDQAAISRVRSASILPAFSTVGLLILCVLSMEWFPSAISALVIAIIVIALGGGIWSMERGIFAVRASRSQR